MESIKEDIEILKKMRLLGEDDDIDIFDELVYKVSLKGDNSSIKELCEVLDDLTSTPSAMDNLIQCIFSITNRCGLEDGLYEIINSTDKMLPKAKNWVMQINRMILNYEPFNDAYVSAIKKLDKEHLIIIIDILYQIRAKYTYKYDVKIDEIVEKV